jgi:hypothetical protein
MGERLAGLFGGKRKDKEHQLALQVALGETLSRLRNSPGWNEGLKPLLAEIRARFTKQLQMGSESEAEAEKARGALNCLDTIESRMTELIQIGERAQEHITKERINARPN